MNPRRLSPWANDLFQVVGLAAAYYSLGRLGLLLAIPPGYATVAWPPSGLALAGVLVLGYRVWPGILLGSFLVNVSTSFAATRLPSTTLSLCVPVLIGVGASLQAILAAYLIRRFAGFPITLNLEWDPVKLLGLGGPASCLLNATWSVTTLWLVGLVPAGTFLPNWLTWWVGDSIGVLVVTPLGLMLFSEPRDIWRQRIGPVGVPLVLTFSLVVTLFVTASRREQARVEHDFAERTEALRRAVQRALDGKVDSLTSLATTLSCVADANHDAFESIVGSRIASDRGPGELLWLPRVLESERAAFEAGERDAGGPGFEILEASDEGTLIPARSRPVHLPVLLVEPQPKGPGVRGFDLASVPAIADALQSTCETRMPVAVRAPDSFQRIDTGVDLVLLAPVFGSAVDSGPADEPCEALRGFVAATIGTSKLVHASFDAFASRSIEIRTGIGLPPPSDTNVPPRFDPARDDDGAGVGEGPSDRRWVAFSVRKMVYARELPIALTLSSTREYLTSFTHWQAGSVLVSGLVFTSLLGAFLLVVTGRSRRIELLVTERTAALSESNAALAREIADRHRAESRFRDLLEAAPDAFVIVDAAGKIVLVNSQTERMFGYTRGELVGEPVELLVPKRRRKRHTEHRNTYMEDPRARPMGQSLDLRGLRKNGTEFPVEISLSPLITDEGVLVSSAIRDISERKRVEADARRHQQELAHTARLTTMGAMATGLAHELNQPLCAIASNSQAALRMLPANDGSPPVELIATLEDIAQGALRAGDIIQHLRDFVRKDAPRVSEIDMNQIVRDIADFIEALSTEHQATIRVELANEALLVLGDRIQLQQVILNMVRNGLEAMDAEEAGGRELLIGSARTAESEITVAVCDRGPGLSSATIDRIFEPFFTTKLNGMGVGLSISRSIVEAFGGRMEVAANPDRGTTFRVVLPAAKEGMR